MDSEQFPVTETQSIGWMSGVAMSLGRGQEQPHGSVLARNWGRPVPQVSSSEETRAGAGSPAEAGAGGAGAAEAKDEKTSSGKEEDAKTQQEKKLLSKLREDDEKDKSSGRPVGVTPLLSRHELVRRMAKLNSGAEVKFAEDALGNSGVKVVSVLEPKETPWRSTGARKPHGPPGYLRERRGVNGEVRGRHASYSSSLTGGAAARPGVAAKPSFGRDLEAELRAVIPCSSSSGGDSLISGGSGGSAAAAKKKKSGSSSSEVDVAFVVDNGPEDGGTLMVDTTATKKKEGARATNNNNNNNNKNSTAPAVVTTKGAITTSSVVVSVGKNINSSPAASSDVEGNSSNSNDEGNAHPAQVRAASKERLSHGLAEAAAAAAWVKQVQEVGVKKGEKKKGEKKKEEEDHEYDFTNPQSGHYKRYHHGMAESEMVRVANAMVLTSGVHPHLRRCQRAGSSSSHHGGAAHGSNLDNSSRKKKRELSPEQKQREEELGARLVQRGRRNRDPDYAREIYAGQKKKGKKKI